MKISTPGVYHVYNRGNNSQKVFFNDKNYLLFLEKCHKYIKPHAEILAWCLMPNHFHFLFEITEKSILQEKYGGNMLTAISKGMLLLQSSYAKSINVEQGRTGSLFQQNTKAKLIEEYKYALTAFWYLHQNPVEAGLASSMQHYIYSSYPDFAGLRNGKLCNRQRAIQLMDMSDIDFKLPARMNFTDEMLKHIL